MRGKVGSGMKKQVSINDVAQEAGVSAATVSYVLNNSPVNLRPETREKVLMAVKTLKYVPNQAAKTLGSSRVKGNGASKLIGVVIPQTEPGKYFMFSNPFYGDFLSMVEYEARKASFHILISGVNAEESYVSIAKNRSLDGVIIVGMYPSDDIAEYRKAKIPVVLVDCYCNEDHVFHSVRTDDRQGGYLATNHLIQNGHRRIAFISGQVKDSGVTQMRYLGYQDALREAGIPLDKSLLFDGTVDFQYGREAAIRISGANAGQKDPITAVFATSDIAAVGAIKGFEQSGLSVPGDVSIVGFDDVYYAELSNLTTIRQNINEKGREAARILIAAAEDAKLSKRERIIPLELVERASVRRIGSAE